MGAVAVGLLFVPVREGMGLPDVTWWQVASNATFLAVTPILGALIASRRPRNPLGWLIMVLPLGLAISFATDGVLRHVRPSDALVIVVWAAQTVSVAGFAALFGVVMYFPDGRLPWRHWRPLPAVTIAAFVLLTLAQAFSADNALIGDVPNPFGIPELTPLLSVLDGVAGVCVVVAMAGLLALVVVRFRRSRGEVRQQMKWFAYGAGVVIGPLMLAIVTEPLGLRVLSDLSWSVGFTLLPAIPIAIGIAILRHRLLDIDLVINRTVVYVALTVVLAAVYIGLVIIFQGLLSGFTGGNSLAVAASTLAVAALFQPARRRIQSAVNRRFYRSRYDAARTLEAFAGRLRHEVDLTRLTDELRGVVSDTLQPASISVWLRRS